MYMVYINYLLGFSVLKTKFEIKLKLFGKQTLDV